MAEAGCGLCAPPEDAAAFAAVVQQFITGADKAAMGRNARLYYERNFTKQGHMDQLEAMLLSMAGGADENP